MTLFEQAEFYNGYGNDTGLPSAQNPTIVPPMDPQVGFPDATGGGEVFAYQDNQELLSLFPRHAASGTWTIAGSVTVGDTIALTIDHPIFPAAVANQIAVYTLAVAGDTVSTIASRLTALLNAEPTLKGYGVTASCVAGVITFKWPGPLGNLADLGSFIHSYAETATVGGTETDGDVLTLTTTLEAPVLNTAKLVVGGTKKTADVFSVTFENALLPNGRHTVSYTVLGGDNNTLIATAIASAITGDSVLAPLGLAVNAAGTSIFLSWLTSAGAVFIDMAVTHAAATTLAFSQTAGSAPSALAPSPLPSESITVGGAPVAGEVCRVTISSPSMTPPVTVSYTVQGGDTTALVAAGIRAAINASAALAAADFSATVLASVVTVTWSAQVQSAAFSGSVAGVFTGALSLTMAPSVVDVAYTTAGSETLTSIATGLKNLVNANVVLAANAVFATSSGAVATLHWNGAIPGAGDVTFSRTLSGGASETLTLADASGAGTETAAAVDPTGGAGPIIPTSNFTTSFGQDPGSAGACGSSQPVYFYAGKPVQGVDYTTLSHLIAQSAPII
jgi:hypothetical protein